MVTKKIFNNGVCVLVGGGYTVCKTNPLSLETNEMSVPIFGNSGRTFGLLNSNENRVQMWALVSSLV